jgi:hypothetical protein
MVSMTLGSMVLAGVLSTYVFLGRNLARLSSYQSLENESRKALAYLSRDFRQASAVKSGTTPTATQVTLVLPSGEVSYVYNSSTKTLRRQATFGVSADLNLLHNNSCQCTTFQFHYYTTSDGAPTDQVSAASNVPYSIKQIQVGYVLESPSTWSTETRTRFENASARYFIRNRGETDGS